MGIFGRIFGGSFAELRGDGDAHFDAKKWGEAKLAYERALDKKKGEAEDAVAHCLKRTHTCRDELAKERIAHAEELLAAGSRELAEAELEGAMETASDEAIARDAERRLETLEKRDARERATEQQIEPEDIYEAVSGNWEPEQADEYATYGEPFRKALLSRFASETKSARAALEDILRAAEDPHYLKYEVGLTRLRDEDVEGGSAMLREFLESIGPDEGGEARLAAHQELARLADERGDEEAAVAELEASMTAFDDDPRPYVMLGNYLRTKGHAREAADVLRAAGEVYISERPDPSLMQELGLALKEAGDEDEAFEMLERMVDVLVTQQRLDLPPPGAIALAELAEKRGDFARAADMWRALSRGSDHAGHLRYHREAGRVLVAAGLPKEARRMLVRASELAKDDEAAAKQIAADLAKLEEES